MAHTRHDSMRRTLRREVVGTIGLLADAEDFTAMRRYRTFTFDDHDTYLHQVEGLLQTLAAQGRHTTVALFDPDAYAEFCAESDLEPDTPASRTRFTAEVAATGPTVPYTGQPIAELLPQLVEEAVRQATWEHATSLLARLGECADCGQDIGRAAFDRASQLLVQVLDAGGPGVHHFVCSVTTDHETLLAALHVEATGDGRFTLDEAEGLEFTTVLAAAIASQAPGGLVMRTIPADGPDRLHGWRLREERLLPLTAAEVFDAYCTDSYSGEPVAPESGVEYCAGIPLLDDDPRGHREH